MTADTAEPFSSFDGEPPTGKKPSRRIVGIALVALVVILAGVAIWWFLIRDDSSGTTGQGSVSESDSQSDPEVPILRIPSLTATATINGEPVDDSVELTFGEESELVVTVLNDGNLTMSDITGTLEFSDADGPLDAESDECEVAVLAPGESGDCTLLFTPTGDMTGAVARVLGYGPQDQEVDLSVTVSFG